MISILRENEEYYINKNYIIYINGYLSEDDEYIIFIRFTNSDQDLFIECCDYDEYIYILKKLKED